MCHQQQTRPSGYKGAGLEKNNCASNEGLMSLEAISFHKDGFELFFAACVILNFPSFYGSWRRYNLF